MNSFPEVGLVVDIVPAILLLALIFSLVSLIAALTSRIMPAPAMYWALGGVGVAGGLLLIVLRGRVPDLASILIGNITLILGQMVMSCGTSRYVGRSIIPDIVLGGSFVAAFGIVYFAGGDVSERVALVALAMIFLCVRMLSGFLSGPGGFGNMLAIVVLSCTILVELGRMIAVYAQQWDWVDPLEITGITMGLSVPSALGIAIAVAVVNWPAFRRLLARLKPAAQNEGPGVWQLASDRSVLITPEGQEVRLTGNEYVVLQRMGASAEPVDRITLNGLIGRDTENPKDRGIDILLSRLRRKCADAGVEVPINSVRGRGYVFHGGLPEV